MFGHFGEYNPTPFLKERRSVGGLQTSRDYGVYRVWGRRERETDGLSPPCFEQVIVSSSRHGGNLGNLWLNRMCRLRRQIFRQKSAKTAQESWRISSRFCAFPAENLQVRCASKCKLWFNQRFLRHQTKHTRNHARLCHSGCSFYVRPKKAVCRSSADRWLVFSPELSLK